MWMQQVEKGKLNLSDKLSQYYPDAPNADKITIENLLTHKSGLGDYAGEHYITSKANLKNTFSVLDNQTNVFKSYENQDGKWVEVEDFV